MHVCLAMCVCGAFAQQCHMFAHYSALCILVGIYDGCAIHCVDDVRVLVVANDDRTCSQLKEVSVCIAM